jgi:hypothetical protein
MKFPLIACSNSIRDGADVYVSSPEGLDVFAYCIIYERYRHLLPENWPDPPCSHEHIKMLPEGQVREFAVKSLTDHYSSLDELEFQAEEVDHLLEHLRDRNSKGCWNKVQGLAWIKEAISPLEDVPLEYRPQQGDVR